MDAYVAIATEEIDPYSYVYNFRGCKSAAKVQLFYKP